MSQHAAFLTAIRENPDDDTPRLAYADFLQENGESEESEFIRAQLQQSQLTADNDRHSTLDARELRLLGAHLDAWTLGPRVLQPGRSRRGFVEYVSGTAIDLIEQLPEAALLAPIRELRITNLGAADGLGARLAALPALAGVDSMFVD